MWHTEKLDVFLVCAWLALELSTVLMSLRSAGPCSWTWTLFAPTPIVPLPSSPGCMGVVTEGRGGGRGTRHQCRPVAQGKFLLSCQPR